MCGYVQYGCGFLSAPREWENFDASTTLRWERTPVLGRLYTKNSQRFPENVKFGDIVKGLPIEPESCKGVYASHVLEHLTPEGFDRAVENTKNILGKGGIFRLLVPDLEWAAREYIRKIDAEDPTANSFFLRETHLGEEERPQNLLGFVHEWLQISRHLWMWDAVSMEHALRKHGFTKVRRCAFRDCDDRMFDLVEDKHRFENAVAMEAIR
jgi:SAM-dependent methyltransferase